MQTYDLAIVGAGMMGLAHALHAARAGLRVAVIERGASANGASVRNFGMLAIVAQRPGLERDSAERALALWQEVAGEAGIALRQAGCLFVAQRPEELAVLHESVAPARASLRMVSPAQIADHAGLRGDRALGGLWSDDAWKVDQRRAMAQLAAWLMRAHGVTFHFSTTVQEVTGDILHTDRGDLRAAHTVICAGDAFSQLFPADFAATGVTSCQLQMLRTVAQPGAYRLSPFVLGGLSLLRYSAFADCPGLPDLRAALSAQQGAALEHGVHLIAAQEDDGSITYGDSHHYGDAAPPERLDLVDDILTEALGALINLPDARIAERWLGRYAHLPGQAQLVLTPAPGVTAVTMTNGQGMTHGLSVAEGVIARITR